MLIKTRGVLILLVLFVSLLVLRGRQAAFVESGTVTTAVPDLSAYPWIYLRDGRALSESEPVVELIVVGDVLLGRGVADEPDPLGAVAPWLRTADLTLGNLESAIVAEGTPRTAPPDGPQPIILNAPVTAVAHLTNAGFDLLSQANNHSLDYGVAGLEETAVRLQQAGITPLGIGPDEVVAYQPVFRQVNGVRLAFLAFNAVPEPANDAPSSGGQWQRAEWNEAQATATVAAARRQADVVMVSLHWGYEYDSQVDPWQKTAAAALLAAGADVIWGHHPHVAQAVMVEQQSGQLVAYSLGNFVFDQTQELTNQGLALRIFVDDTGVRAVQALPLWAGSRPRLMSLAEAEPLLARIAPAPSRLAFACQTDGCAPVGEVADSGEQGWFWSGAIDLTGDGTPEIIRRAAERVTVYEGDTAVWQSPSSWRVVDLALGDPNDDGRFEMLLAIMKPDPDGHERSQPYIVGHWGGAYQLLWGGRPVQAPILAVELGDVDGDGAQEMVVLEDQGDEQTISVWRWQGWNFSLLWRSENGRYRDLTLQVAADNRLLLVVTPQAILRYYLLPETAVELVFPPEVTESETE
ncbi:MAG TPA: CapA family protein [Chloroflexota bacterium]|nr:CapA family protein [Chloroflexota bacterium]